MAGDEVLAQQALDNLPPFGIGEEPRPFVRRFSKGLDELERLLNRKLRDDETYPAAEHANAHAARFKIMGMNNH
jgi:hypothetical protein